MAMRIWQGHVQMVALHAVFIQEIHIPAPKSAIARKYANSFSSMFNLERVWTYSWILQMEAVTSFTLIGWFSRANLDCWWETIRLRIEGMETCPDICAKPSTKRSDQLFLTSPICVSYLKGKTFKRRSSKWRMFTLKTENLLEQVEGLNGFGPV